MASICRLARALRPCRTIASAKTLSPRLSSSSSSLLSLSVPLSNPSYKQRKTYGSEGPIPGVCDLSFHAVLAGFLGYGLSDVAFADGDEAVAKNPPPPEFVDTPPMEFPHDLEEIARRDKSRLEELLKSKGGLFGSLPRFTVAVKEQKVAIRFEVPPSCEIPLLIMSLFSRLGFKPKDNSFESDMRRAWDSGFACKFTLRRPKEPNLTSGDQVQSKDKSANDGELCILMFRPLTSSAKAEFEFMKRGSFTFEELDALASFLHAAASLERKGVKVYVTFKNL